MTICLQIMSQPTAQQQVVKAKGKMPKIQLNEKEEKNSQSYHSHTSVRPENGNTLGSLTKKFVELIQNAPNKTIQIHQASQILCIQKRRIYDITNVLQGIGYIEKLGKNQMRWVGGDNGSQLQKDAYELQRKSQNLDIATKKIQQQIQMMKELLIEQSKKTNYSFFSLEDMACIMKQRQISKILVYTGGLGDQMQVDSNPQTKISQCTISSNNKEAKLYLCTLSDQKINVVKEDDQHFQKMNDFNFLQKQRRPLLDIPELIINGSIYELDESCSFQQNSL